MAEWVVDHYGVSSGSDYPSMLDGEGDYALYFSASVQENNLRPDSFSSVSVGCGNAHLLLLLAESGYSPSQLTGIDYSEASIELSKAIIKDHEEEDFSGITLEAVDVIQDDYSQNGTKQYDLVLDKGVS